MSGPLTACACVAIFGAAALLGWLLVGVLIALVLS